LIIFKWSYASLHFYRPRLLEELRDIRNLAAVAFRGGGGVRETTI